MNAQEYEELDNERFSAILGSYYVVYDDLCNLRDPDALFTTLGGVFLEQVISGIQVHIKVLEALRDASSPF